MARNSLFKTKSIDLLMAQTEEKGHKLKRALGAFDLTLLGIGGIIGTGIFVLTGVGAALHAGPAITLSFVISGLACVFAALCYAEFASMIPVAGSAYTYSYATLGELFAWIIGWDLILEYAVSSITVAIGWSGYFVNLLRGVGIVIPEWACTPPLNIPAALITAVMTTLLVVGIRESARFNNVIVVIKVAVILFFIGFGAFFVRAENWSPFMPFGFSGVMTGAAIVFFAYIGFDAVSTAAEETKNPQRNLPIGIITSLVVCTVLYIVVSFVLTGIVPMRDFAKDQAFLAAPIAFALSLMHQGWASGIISIGAVAGITSVLLVMMMGQPRVFFAMSRDGLIPQGVSKVHPRFQTPYITTIITGVAVGLIAMMITIGTAAELANIGTLFAFAIVTAGIVVLRRTNPELERPFRTPLISVVAPVGLIFIFYLMFSLPVLTWIRFLTWLDIGLVLYFFYGRSHSRIATAADRQMSLSYFLDFWGVAILFNGALFGVLSLLALAGLTAIRYWTEIQFVRLEPHHAAAVSGIVAAVGLAMLAAGRLTKGRGQAA
ncbi:MAG: amino acid permease family protein [Acidobacteria bacterium]|nr:amino acid permease family protein [Acidobacteriota bacterium]